jgi:hypothetical protein
VRENVLEALRRKSLGYSRSISKSEKKIREGIGAVQDDHFMSTTDTSTHNFLIHIPSNTIYPHLLQTSSAHKSIKKQPKNYGFGHIFIQ